MSDFLVSCCCFSIHLIFAFLLSDDYENRYEDKEKSPRDRKDYEFKDEDEEYTSVERTQTTHTEKITTNIRTTRSGKKLDLGAAAMYGKEANQVKHTLLLLLFNCRAKDYKPLMLKKLKIHTLTQYSIKFVSY